MNADFTNVRVHTGTESAQLNKQLNSHAFTHGRDIYFNSGKYNPCTQEGKYLLAHELTHTLQQSKNIIRRLTVSPVGNLSKRTCGGLTKHWNFKLTSPAPSEGYMVLQNSVYDEIKDCPRTARCLATPTYSYWEAWHHNRGDKLDDQHAAFGFTDRANHPSVSGKSGYFVQMSEIKFFSKTTTGDLGNQGVPPASPNGGWTPGGHPMSGGLPSTKTRPPWWGNTSIEGPGTRSAYSAWHCCPTGSNFNVVRATP